MEWGGACGERPHRDDGRECLFSQRIGETGIFAAERDTYGVCLERNGQLSSPGSGRKTKFGSGLVLPGTERRGARNQAARSLLEGRADREVGAAARAAHCL